MKFEQPLFWRQGMFLQPHHFQYMDQHQYQMTRRHYAMSHSYNWGFNQLSIDESALANVILDLQSFEAVMPDGAYVCYPGNVDISARGFDAVWQNRTQPLKLFLVIRKLDPLQRNVMDSTEADSQRYIVQNEIVLNDVYSGDTEVEVSTLQYHCFIISSEELTQYDKHVILPVAEIIQGIEAPELSNQFAPPCLSIEASKSLAAISRTLKEEVVQRATKLEEYKGQSNDQADFSHKMLRYRLALQTLSRYALLLQNIIDAPGVHPWDLYNIYSQLVGELTAYTIEYNVLGERKGDDGARIEYKHDNLGLSFNTISRLIFTLLNVISVRPDLLVHLERKEPHLFSNNIPDNIFNSNRSFYLVLKTKENFESLFDSFIHFAKIGSSNNVSELVNRALPGVEISYVSVHPEGLPRYPNASYFLIEQKCSEWHAVRTSRNISIIWQDAPSDLTVELIVTGGD